MSQTTFDWTETRLRAIELFRDVPSAELEQRVLDVFLEHPHLVIEAVESIGRRFEQGKVNRPWPVLAKHVSEAMKPLEGVASDERDRDKAIRRAEQWVKVAGKHFDSGDEVEVELFGDLGILATWRDDEALHERMAQLWAEVRPEGLLIEEQAEERARAYIAANGQVPGERGLPVTRPPWKVPLGETRIVEPGMEDEPVVELDPEPAVG
jgi:hypothetical protein